MDFIQKENGMSTTEVKRSETAKEVSTMEPQQKYLEEKFPLAVGEYQVDYKPVGENKFRINFWSYTPESKGMFMRGSRITRSHYVVLKKDGLSWNHAIV